jgi:hypothetical protein
MDKQEKIDIIREAQEKLFEAIELLHLACVGVEEKYITNYVIAPLEIVASNNSRWLNADYNLDRWIIDLENGEYDEEGES